MDTDLMKVEQETDLMKVDDNLAAEVQETTQRHHGYRMERDSIGELPVPEHVYYGVQSLRASKNFPITGNRLHPELIRNLARVKKACARANQAAGILDENIARAIVSACDDILNDLWHEQFIVDAIQGGAGTSANMNANEVIANIATERMGGRRGDYNPVHPNDHVNMSQSTNDVFPTAGKLSVISLVNVFVKVLEDFIPKLDAKAAEFNEVYKMGRTQLQDAVPMRLGQSFSAAASALRRNMEHLKSIEKTLYTVNLGGTAIGTGINASPVYMDLVVPMLADVSGIELEQAENLIDATQNLDSFVMISGAVKAAAVTLSKFANDLRILSSGPRTGFNELNLPPVQNGSSIMPGKINPVIPEAVSQVAFSVIGNDVTITMAAEGGQLELNAFEPVLFYKLFESLDTRSQVVHVFGKDCIDGITANKEDITERLENSTYLATVLSKTIGYERSATLAHEAEKAGKSIREMALIMEVVTEEELERLAFPGNYC